MAEPHFTICEHCQNTGSKSLIGRAKDGRATYDRIVCPDENCPHRTRYLRQVSYLSTVGLARPVPALTTEDDIAPRGSPAGEQRNRKAG
ncbi:hypothetical protein [Crossiella cryophila]|uniref:Uncharacterized protein n=1 Tax=Crossiella cryophila TaxID=43355 RepID=A0A7W7CE74_9PSEU|nr:hypothetical protein [Crossiella cryophila]MBB4679526.1 hypothetical protein [Crossiella cryophila]